MNMNWRDYIYIGAFTIVIILLGVVLYREETSDSRTQNDMEAVLTNYHIVGYDQ